MYNRNWILVIIATQGALSGAAAQGLITPEKCFRALAWLMFCSVSPAIETVLDINSYVVTDIGRQTIMDQMSAYVNWVIHPDKFPQPYWAKNMGITL